MTWRLTRRRQAALAGLILAAALTTFAFRNPWFRGNFGVVDDGQVYRSAQPLGSLGDLIAEKRIATVLNLRGGSDKDPWYADEVAATARLGVDFYDLPLVATARPTRAQLLAVIDVLDRCQYPLLIHCKSGSDRTGLVSGLYLMTKKGVDPARAEDAFSLYYGHVPLLGTKHLHEPFREYAAWLASNALEHTPERLKDWVARDYWADDAYTKVEPLKPGPRPRRSARVSAAGVPR